MNSYQFNKHCPLDEQFRAGSRIFTKLMQNDKYCMYEVTDLNNGDPYTVWEVFELRKFKVSKNKRKPSSLNEGDYYYPTANEFGYWAWCYNDKEYALKQWEKKNS